MKQKAFTLLELLLVFALVGILFGMTLLYAQVSQVRADLNSQVDTFVAYARLAQSESASGKGNQGHGIHLAADSYVLFEGSVYNAAATSNTEVELPPTVEIQNIVLNGGGSDIVFTTPYGATTQYGSFDFVSEQLGKSITLTLNARGTLSY
ncbi:MAG: prepilin-type N-terminal cleavage/methylation domain-containing protein [Patescibacteria group bacterium]